ncbi:MAG: hypothetical protein GY874_09165 [Desulfobacteraceae bacterium]|nr:hypothetical protein [Desulfobacteraceae bacterium]
MERSIIHLNIADFAVAVERRLDRRLAQRPLIIAPEGAVRATVYDMSEEAYQAGIRKGMALRRAVRLCRDALILPPQPARYEQAMGELLRQALPYSPLIEPGQRDGHLFVDVTGTSRLFGPPADIALRLRRQARKELDLAPIWTLAANKLVAKVASRLVKPLGEFIVSPGEEETFLSLLPIELIPGFEKTELTRLLELNLTRVNHVTGLGPEHLEVVLGNRAGPLSAVLRGEDTSPVLPFGKRPPRVTASHTFGTDSNTLAVIEGVLYELVEQVCKDLRNRQRAAQQVSVCVDYSDGRRRVRQVRVQPPTANDLALFPFARKTLHLAWNRRVRLRHLELVCDRLVHPPTQIPIFEHERRPFMRREKLVSAMDKIRDRFGRHAIEVGRRLTK